MGLIFIHQKVRKRKKLPLTPSLIKAREEHKKFLDSIGHKKERKTIPNACTNQIVKDKHRKKVNG